MAGKRLIGANYITPDLLAKVTGRAKYAEDFRVDGDVPRNTMFGASGLVAGAAVASFSAGSDFPVRAACNTNRSRAVSRRASAGTRSPADSRTTSPGHDVPPLELLPVAVAQDRRRRRHTVAQLRNSLLLSWGGRL